MWNGICSVCIHQQEPLHWEVFDSQQTTINVTLPEGEQHTHYHFGLAAWVGDLTSGLQWSSITYDIEAGTWLVVVAKKKQRMNVDHITCVLCQIASQKVWQLGKNYGSLSALSFLTSGVKEFMHVSAWIAVPCPPSDVRFSPRQDPRSLRIQWGPPTSDASCKGITAYPLTYTLTHCETQDGETCSGWSCWTGMIWRVFPKARSLRLACCGRTVACQTTAVQRSQLLCNSTALSNQCSNAWLCSGNPLRWYFQPSTGYFYSLNRSPQVAPWSQHVVPSQNEILQYQIFRKFWGLVSLLSFWNFSKGRNVSFPV